MSAVIHGRRPGYIHARTPVGTRFTFADGSVWILLAMRHTLVEVGLMAMRQTLVEVGLPEGGSTELSILRWNSDWAPSVVSEAPPAESAENAGGRA